MRNREASALFQLVLPLLKYPDPDTDHTVWATIRLIVRVWYQLVLSSVYTGRQRGAYDVTVTSALFTVLATSVASLQLHSCCATVLHTVRAIVLRSELVTQSVKASASGPCRADIHGFDSRSSPTFYRLFSTSPPHRRFTHADGQKG